MLDSITSRFTTEADSNDDTGLPRFELSEHDAHAALSNERRCHVIRTVKHTGGTTLDELATQISLFEFDEGTGQPRKRVYIALYQTHLPHLHSAGAVEYDADTGAVTPGPNLDGLAALLDATEEASEVATDD